MNTITITDEMMQELVAFLRGYCSADETHCWNCLASDGDEVLCDAMYHYEFYREDLDAQLTIINGAYRILKQCQTIEEE